MYSPQTEYLKRISDGLANTDIPIYFKLPDSSVQEPFYVVANHDDDDSRSAKFGPAIVDSDLTIHLFYSTNSRTQLEEAIFKTKVALGARRQISSRFSIDDSIGRECYHVVFSISDFII
ncbi:hypothetical protein [Enterococcus sp. DIV0800]|uniref:hypothetical protein n=1 Tax=unclassified Enterococcus TaxID=2608891 RepID=UPI003D2FC5E0